MCAGVMVSLFGYFLFKSYQSGGLAYTGPVIWGSVIAATTLAGIFIFKEQSNALQIAGVLIILIGVGCVIAAKA